MRILVLDNYDSFTYNLVQYIRETWEGHVEVFRNDEIDLEAVEAYDVVVLSPGPGLPSDAGIMPELIRTYAGKIPILGVCLGHQAIGEAFGGTLKNLQQVYHGIETPVHLTQAESPVFAGLPGSIRVGRYHSWVIRKEDLPEVLETTAVDDRGEIMAIQHKTLSVVGLQFHPESIMTAEGKHILKNFFDHMVRTTHEVTELK